MIFKFLVAFFMALLSADYTATLPDGSELKLMVADSPIEMEVGLMYRQHLEQDRGMIFVFDDNKIANVWMKNTYIPLDIIFLDENNTIVKIVENAEPKSLDVMSSDKPARYFIEVNSGYAARHKLRVGDAINISVSA